MENQVHFHELSELMERLELLFKARGVLQQLEESKRRESEQGNSWFQWLERWHNKSAPGVSSATVVSIAALTFGRQYTVPFWFSLCLFPVLNPTYATSVFTGQVIPFFYDREQEYTIEEAEECTASLFVLSGYVGWLLGLQLLAWFVHVTYFFFEHPVFACTLFSCGYLVSRQKPWLKYCRVKMDALLYITLLWMGNFYNRIRIRLSKCMEWLAQSTAIRFFSSCLRRVLVLLLWQPNFDKLGKFEYAPLDVGKREIRLLRIQRKIPFCDLKCELMYVSLDEAESYQAVSYCWGENGEKTERIILDNKQFGVRSAVYNVLRGRSSVFASRLIWIDFICINQGDTTEKGNQVRLMNDIYKKASRVFVCLGDAPDARLGISLVHELVFMSSWVSKTALAKNVLGYSNRIDNGDELLKSRLTGLLDLLHHPWFRKVWIIQEVVVAKSLTVLYSNYVLVWDYLILFMEIFGDHEMSEVQSQFDPSGQDFINNPPPNSPRHAASLDYFQKGFRRGERAPLNQSLRIFSAFGRTCPRDKIFALLGFAKPGPGILELIDYDKKLSEVLYDVAKYLYFQEGILLTVLHFAGIGWDDVEPDCPSWVPNWTISREPTTLAHAACDMIDHYIQYRAAIQIESQIYLWSEARILKLRGQSLDKIKAISIVPDNFLPSRKNIPVKELDEFTSWLENAQTLAEKLCENPYPWPVGNCPTKQPVNEAFWRTLVGDRTLSARPAPSSYSKHFAKLLGNINKLRTLAKKHDGDALKVRKEMNKPSFFETVDESMEWQRDLTNAGWLFGQPGFPRNFCITEKGLMGMVPKHSKIGDVICLIYGAQVPFVLRTSSEEKEASDTSETMYQLVGECYIHGMMDGEGLSMGNWEGDFTIK